MPPTWGAGRFCERCRENALVRNLNKARESLPDRWRVSRYEDLRQADDKIAMARDYADNAHRRLWLVMSGSSGLGKTTLAAALYLDMAARYVGAYNWINAAEFAVGVIDASQRGGLREYLNKWRTPDVLVFDDLGTESYGETVRTSIYYVINDRYEYNRRTIITTNLNMTDMQKKLGQQIADRMLRSGPPIKFEGESIPLQEVREENRRRKAISGEPAPGSVTAEPAATTSG